MRTMVSAASTHSPGSAVELATVNHAKDPPRTREGNRSGIAPQPRRKSETDVPGPREPGQSPSTPSQHSACDCSSAFGERGSQCNEGVDFARRYDLGVSFDRVTVTRDVMGGVACVRGTRIPVATVVAMVADGMSAAEIVDEFPQLEVEDVAEALRYAAQAVDVHELPIPLVG